MNNSDIFLFGSKIFVKETKRDAITNLPLELSWKIFSYLDGASLRVAYQLHKTWAGIISANTKLRRSLSQFHLELKLGPSLAKFHRKNRNKKRKGRNYLPCGETKPTLEYWMWALRPLHTYTMKKTVMKTKRGGDGIVIHTKRFRLF